MPLLDVVVVTYNNERHIRACVSPLCGADNVSVTVVDNDSADGTVEVLQSLKVELVQLTDNHGFAFGCNVGWRAGKGDFVVFLNPDCRTDAESLLTLVGSLEDDSAYAVAGPRIVHANGEIELSQHRFLTPSRSLARALLLHRLSHRSEWLLDITDPAAYRVAGSPDWLGGACLAIRRSTLEACDGFDEQFFMYFEDMDLCRRIRERGYDIRYEPDATVEHSGGASAPKTVMIPVFATSRIRYAQKHGGVLRGLIERSAVIIEAAIRLLLNGRTQEHRSAYVRCFRVAVSRMR